jgi:TRAP-type mannitol/chloroaromatic compound transport system permease large subunit
MQHIHLGTIPFVLLQLTAVGVVMAFLKFAFWWPLATGFLE